MARAITATVALTAVLTLAGCAQTVNLSSLNKDVNSQSRNVNEAKAWTETGSSPILGLRLFVASTKPSDVARSIQTIAPTLQREVPGSYTVEITVVPGADADYPDYFAVKQATVASMREVAKLLKLNPTGRSRLDLSANDLKHISG